MAQGGGQLADNIVHFARALRAAGIPVGPGAVARVLRCDGVLPIKMDANRAMSDMTPDDLRAFEMFIRGGGTLVCLNNASAFAIEQFKLPVKNAVAGLRSEDFFLRGSIVEVTTASAVVAA